ncbi:IPI1/TEX10 family protein [Aspergillus ibericus CBS 121593]|uniref:Pre-rRNA-processing protein n=1 Tax=Aspergillus ibericus CBS 121593 TaxID=1448316 RepID=A0A395GMI5_9EURO|nr:Pre-rRNA-processing protein Ipi1 [Aspergillus ibericus CBS 121593]RAK96689.1 Pre-rRNA-processing protein Ipi1 [Aspergillus ibericus CBS 121593]
MGSSAKKKKEKQKDFQKAKLKVGKAKGKPENFTDTSFKTKGITLTQQSLTLTAPSTQTQFTHHVSLLNSKSDTQRRDSLAHLTTHISSKPTSQPLPQPVSTLLPTLSPLILDASTNVRTQLLKLLRALPPADVEDHVVQLMPYIRAGMTHLAADIRVTAIEVLSWLVEIAGDAVVSCAGGWIKTLNCFLSVLGWHTEESSKWSSNRAAFGKAGAKGRPMVKVLGVLAEFLQAGIGEEDEDEDVVMGGAEVESGYGSGDGGFPIVQTEVHMVPKTAQPYVYLNLFGSPRDEEGEMYETREERFRVFKSRFLVAVERGVESARQDGGEVGRASSAVSKVLKEARGVDWEG